jgi:RAD54-like protein 2
MRKKFIKDILISDTYIIFLLFLLVVERALLTPCLVVCDEGHRIKNSAANIAKTLQRIETKRRIVLTGYPLQNNLIEYWCMVDFVRPNYLGTKAEFSNMFERPITNGQCMDSTREDVKLMRYRAHVLHSLLEGFVQRRGHDVFFCSLPKKYEYIILLKLSAIQKELYLAFMESIGAMQPGEKINPLRSFAICCKIWNHPDVLHKFNCDKESEIDLDLPELQVKKTHSNNNKATAPAVTINPIYEESCGGFNPFGPASYYDARNNNNKTGLDPDWANKIMDTYVPNTLENGAKFLLSFSIIEESVMAGDKILLFSQSLLSLNLIEEYLQRLNVPNTDQKWEKYKTYYRLDGSTTGVERERLINLFNKPNNTAWLFLLSTRAGCLGINLIGANRVIVLDASWNPCHDAQAVCRIYRYGQQKNCYIYRLIADHTMEKKIYDRQVSKQTMSDRVIDEIQTENHFTRTEVEKLIHFVKEDMPSADLSQMPNKYEDSVLVKSCMRNANYITKEPFTHESLLIDKKEYKLSEREKQLALSNYQHDKRYFPNARQSYASNPNLNSYSHLLNQKYPVNLSRSPLNYNPLPNGYYTSMGNGNGAGHNTINCNGYGKNILYNRILSENNSAHFNENKNLDFSLHRSMSSSSLVNNGASNNYVNDNNNNNNNNNSYAGYNSSSYQNPTIMKCLNGSSNLHHSNSFTGGVTASSVDFVINNNYNNEVSILQNGSNGQQFVQQQPPVQQSFNLQ